MDTITVPSTTEPRIVIVGCGFGGLELAKALRQAAVQIVMLDANNYHTFQPLLYQVATAGLEADAIAYPIRKIFRKQKNFHFRWGKVQHINPEQKLISTSIGRLNYDHLVLATGSTNNFFGNTEFEQNSMPMKSVTEALNLRSLILQNFENALLATSPAEQEALMTVVIVGAGPTGVELAGALCELKKHVLPYDYPELDLNKMRIILLENGDEVLQVMAPPNSERAKNYLNEMGCEIWLNTALAHFDGNVATTKDGKQIKTNNVIWSAGVRGASIDGLRAESLNKRNRFLVDEYNAVTGYENIYAIGDVAAMVTAENPNGHPQLAPVAQQQGRLLARNIMSKLKGQPLEKFHYFDKGSMATIGRNKAVVEIGKLTFGGFPGWFAWMSLHLMLLVGFRNKIIVFITWLWNYVNYDRNIRLIIRPFERERNKF